MDVANTLNLLNPMLRGSYAWREYYQRLLEVQSSGKEFVSGDFNVAIGSSEDNTMMNLLLNSEATLKIRDLSAGYLYFKNTTGGDVKLVLERAGDVSLFTPPELQYSTDKINWTDWLEGSQAIRSLIIAPDKVVYLRAKTFNSAFTKVTLDGYSIINSCLSTFNATDHLECGGDLKYLLSKDGSVSNIPAYCFYRLFASASWLLSTPHLSSVSLGPFSCAMMYENCTAIEEPMNIEGIIDDFACEAIYKGCSSLQHIATIDTTQVGFYAFKDAYKGCSSITGTVKPFLTSIASVGVAKGMFSGCTSIEAAIIDFVSVAYESLYAMFKGCSSLKTLSVKFYEWNHDSDATKDWVSGVSASGEFSSGGLPIIYGDDYVPYGWTVL